MAAPKEEAQKLLGEGIGKPVADEELDMAAGGGILESIFGSMLESEQDTRGGEPRRNPRW